MTKFNTCVTANNERRGKYRVARIRDLEEVRNMIQTSQLPQEMGKCVARCNVYAAIIHRHPVGFIFILISSKQTATNYAIRLDKW